ncbi:MAG: NfeD family protein [Kiloniellales bacterium]|nr:NfeD family protein [Kiloniellales bacterium]
MEFVEQAEFWHWWIAAIVLLVIETFAPGAIFLWLGMAAGAVGLALLLLPGLAWEYQFLIFALATVLSAVGWRAYAKRRPAASDRPALNRRGAQYVGRTFTLEEAIVNGHGKIRVDDSTWKVEGEDLPAGSLIRVTGVDGTVLKVEAA